jgi:hypothetical protein
MDNVWYCLPILLQDDYALMNKDQCPVQRCYPDEKNRVTITCPHCSKSKTVDSSPFAASKRDMRIRCTCGRPFISRIEFRRCYRKRSKLGGNYENKESGEKGELLVWDLSMTGLGFTPISIHTLKPGDIVHLSFTLDNLNRDLIERIVKVCNVRGNRIGAEFLPDQPVCRELNFYLLP